MIVNTTRHTCIAMNQRVARSFFSRLKGLLGTDSLEGGSALIIDPCTSIHTFGMSYPIDVLFIGCNDKVLRVICSLQPGRAAICAGSRYVIELPAGAAKTSLTQVGDEIILTD